MRHRRFLVGALAIVIAGLWPVSALRASVTGSRSGAVTDPSGAAIAGAKVTLDNPDSGLRQETKTGSDGSYEFLAVPAGEHYSQTEEQ
jgi:hypothetical protein